MLDQLTLQVQNITANTTITVPGPGGLGVDLVVFGSGTASQLTTGLTLYGAAGNFANNLQSRLTNPGQAGSGGRIRVRNDSAFPQPITAAGSDTIYGVSLLPPNSFVDLFSDGISGWYVEGPFMSSTSGASGLIVAQTTLTAAQVLAMYAAPIQIVVAPAAGQVVRAVDFELSTAPSTQFANGGAVILQYDSTANGAGTNSLTNTIAAAIINNASAQFAALKGADLTGAAASGFAAKGLYISNATGAFTAGTGSTVKLTVTYRVITF
jgi:hypothetical protein